MHDDHDPQHRHGLAHDLRAMERLLQRRRALKWCAGAGTAALVAGCGGTSADTIDSTTAAPPRLPRHPPRR